MAGKEKEILQGALAVGKLTNAEKAAVRKRAVAYGRAGYPASVVEAGGLAAVNERLQEITRNGTTPDRLAPIRK